MAGKLYYSVAAAAFSGFI